MNWLRKFMYGRYGSDPLNMALLILALVLNFIPYFFARIISIALLVFIFYRMFSKNIYKRQQENAAFMRVFWPIWSKIRGFFVRMKTRWRARKYYKYYHCPKCRQELRVPKGKGKLAITCPKCHEKFYKTT